jgi:hypothetical protein
MVLRGRSCALAHLSSKLESGASSRPTCERRLRLRVRPGIGHMNRRHLNVATCGTVEMPESEAESLLRAGWV